MLKSDEILDFLKQRKKDLETRFSVRRIGLFGSVLRGSAGDKSDVDILVELAHPTSDHYMDLKFSQCILKPLKPAAMQARPSIT